MAESAEKKFFTTLLRGFTIQQLRTVERVADELQDELLDALSPSEAEIEMAIKAGSTPAVHAICDRFGDLLYGQGQRIWFNWLKKERALDRTTAKPGELSRWEKIRLWDGQTREVLEAYSGRVGVSLADARDVADAYLISRGRHKLRPQFNQHV